MTTKFNFPVDSCYKYIQTLKTNFIKKNLETMNKNQEDEHYKLTNIINKYITSDNINPIYIQAKSSYERMRIHKFAERKNLNHESVTSENLKTNIIETINYIGIEDEEGPICGNHCNYCDEYPLIGFKLDNITKKQVPVKYVKISKKNKN
jgi:hypothetical protein